MAGVKCTAALVVSSVLAFAWLTEQAAGTQADSEARAKPSQPDVRYRIECRADDPLPHWVIDVNITGLDSAERDVELRLDRWGGWTGLDSLYFNIVGSDPPVVRDWEDPGLIRFAYPNDWNGAIRLTYRLSLVELGSNAQQRYGRLMPFHADRYSAGFVQNTLIRVQRAGEMLRATRLVELEAPANWSVVTGWAGISRQRQSVTLDRDDENGIIAFGIPVAQVSNADTFQTAYDVVQFNDGANAALRTGEIVQTLITQYSHNTGMAPERPVRVILVEGHNGGTHTAHGLLVDPPSTADEIASPDYAKLVAHELFHTWLGGLIEPQSRSMVWFSEGFTDYFAAWHTVSVGLASPQWFVDQIMAWDAEAEASGVRDEAAFGDPNIRWRDDGYERYAYNGGALLAFMIDVELRRQGRPGLPALIDHLLHDEHAPRTLSGNVALTLAPIRAWLETQGLAEFVRRHIDAAKRFDLPPTLAVLGCTTEDGDAPLTYLGIRADREGIPAVVVEVDDDGPAARAGVRVGDTIVGYFPTRATPPEIGPAVTSAFRFGLAMIEPHYAGVFIDIVRDGSDVRIPLEPTVIAGGRVARTRVDEDRIAPFLLYEKREP